MDCSLPGSSVYGILQARMLEWVAVPSSKGIFPTQGSNLNLLGLPASAGRFFTTSATWVHAAQGQPQTVPGGAPRA